MFMDASVLPPELIVTPQPLIGLCGLDIIHNNTHKTIWEAFSNNRKPDRVAVQFKLLATDYDFPVLKPKRQSYEWYHPRGILKRNWMLKHLHILPSVIVLFQDIEWNDPQWTEKQLQCASLVQCLKNSLQGRNTRIVVVLLQKGAATLAGEDSISLERASNLTSKCDISAKMLFVLPHNDHLMGYALRLESQFLELAQSYYAQMARQVRLHRDQLTDSHQNLKIRHLFKLGFISEMRMDFSNALKHYSQAYSNLEDIRIIDTNCLEIKVIAGFLNYKICKLMFKSNLPKDSITQFKFHIEKYKNRLGFKELRFEHFAWLSVQYNAFAELFCEAIKNGLAASQTQHPGIYYHKSAEYIGNRKEAFLECCALSMSPTEPISPTLTGLLHSDFFGVRGAKNSEPMTEQQIISLIQENEKAYNHSGAIINLLGQAMAQYKVNKCLRFRKKLAIDMADEYLKCGDHSKALTLYSLMLSDYRFDKWYQIFTEVLLKTLRSAYLSASVADFVTCSIEAMSPYINTALNERINILENLWKVFQNVPPVSSIQITPELKLNWENALLGFKTPIVIDLDKISKLFECKLTFEKPQIKFDESVNLELYIKSNTEVPFKFKKFSVTLNDLKSNYKLYGKFFTELHHDMSKNEIKLLDKDEFFLEPEKFYKINFYGEKYQFVENVELQILKLEIEMGTEHQYVILTQSSTLNQTKSFKEYNPHSDLMDLVKINSFCYIIPTFHLTTQINQTSQPMLVNEYFKVITSINNTFDVCLRDVGLSITIAPNFQNKVFLTTDITKNTQQLLSQIHIDIGEISMQSTTNVIYYITSIVEGNIELLQNIWYKTESLQPMKTSPQNTTTNVLSFESPPPAKPNLDNKNRKKLLNSHNIKIDYVNENIVKYKEDIIIIPCIEEITISAKFYTLSRQALMRAYKNEDFLLRINADIKSNIDILDTYFISDYNIQKKNYSGEKKMIGHNYKKNGKLEEIHILCSDSITKDWITKKHFESQKNKLTFKNHHIDSLTVCGNAACDDGNAMVSSTGSNYLNTSNDGNMLNDDLVYNKNLLSKLPMNSTIIGNNSLANNQMISLNISMTNEQNDSMNSSFSTLQNQSTSQNMYYNNKINDERNPSVSNKSVKIIYNRAVDALNLINEKRGFFKNVQNLSNSSGLPIFGVYCIKWRRTDDINENESKFIINGIEIIEPVLNLYCYFTEKMYVRTPMTLNITLKNPSSKIIYLQASLNNSDSFMFAGHKQVNISLFSHSNFILNFNLYPLKLGWQQLPELLLEYNTQYDPEKKDELQQIELNNLIKRWMPKFVFIHPPSKILKS